MSAHAIELVEQTERFTRAFMGRLSSARTLDAQTELVKAGVQQTRNLLDLRERGYEISDELVGLCFDELNAALERMVELMPHEERRRR